MEEKPTYHIEACHIACAASRLLGGSVVLKQDLLSCVKVFTHRGLSPCLLPLMLSMQSFSIFSDLFVNILIL